MRPALANIITARVPEADLLIDTMEVRPQGNRAFLISDTIRRLKAADIWAKLDVLWMLAAHDAQAGRLNWKSPSTFALTAVNSPTFTADRGYAGNGTSSYLDTGWIPATHAVMMSLNSVSIGGYLNAGTDTGLDTIIMMGSIDGSSNGLFIAPRSLLDTPRGRVNSGSGTTTNTSGTITTRLGFTVYDRAASSGFSGYRNGVLIGTATVTSSALPTTYAAAISANNVAGTAFSFIDNTVGQAFFGASLTAAQHATLYRITQNYLTSMGAAA